MQPAFNVTGKPSRTNESFLIMKLGAPETAVEHAKKRDPASTAHFAIVVVVGTGIIEKVKVLMINHTFSPLGK